MPLAGLFFALPTWAGDDRHLLPATPVTLHGTMSAYDAYLTVSKTLKVTFWPVVPGKDQVWADNYQKMLNKLKSTSVDLNLDNASGEHAFDVISGVSHNSWETLPGPPRTGQVFVTVSAKPQ